MRLTYEALAEGLTGADILRSLLREFGAGAPSNGRAVRKVDRFTGRPQ
jgi:hypothetical protein